MDVSKAASSKGEERLKRKLKLQEMRCELLNTEMSRLKTLIANKDKELKEAERKRKQAENRRKSEESRRKKDRKEIQKIKKESEKRFKLIEGFKKELARVNGGDTEPQSDESKVEQSSDLSVDNLCTKKANGAEVNLSAASSIMMEVEAAEGNSLSPNGFVPPKIGVDSVNDGASCSSSVPNDPRLETLFESDLMCSICHEIFIKPVVLSNCSHVFCAFCIDEWRRNHHNCPICRDLILASLPEQVLENVIEKVVSTMTGESITHRKNLIEDRKKRMEENPPDHSDWRGEDSLGWSLFRSDSSNDSAPYEEGTFDGGSNSSHSIYEDERSFDSSDSIEDDGMFGWDGEEYDEYQENSDDFHDEEDDDLDEEDEDDEDDLDDNSSHYGMRDAFPGFSSHSDRSDTSDSSEDSDDPSSDHITISDDEDDSSDSDDYSSSNSSFDNMRRDQHSYPYWSPDSSSDYSD